MKIIFLFFTVLLFVTVLTCQRAFAQSTFNTMFVDTYFGYDISAMTSLGDTAYFGSENLLISADISNPENPIYLDTLAWLWYKGIGLPGMALQYPYLYVLTLPDSVVVVDITNPANLRSVFRFRVNAASGEFVSSIHPWKHFILTCDAKSISLYDVFSPTNPKKNDSLDVSWYTLGTPWDSKPLFINGNTLFYDSSRNLRVARIEENGTFTIVANDCSIPYKPGAYWMLDSVFYYPVDHKIFVFDVNEVFSFILLDTIEIDGLVIKTEIAGNRMFVLTSIGYLDIYNVDDPVHPILIASFTNPVWGPFVDLIVRGDYFFIASYAGMGVIVGKVLDSTQSISSDSPTSLSLSPAYPNPVTSTAIIEYTLPARQYMTLELYNALGQKVRSLFTGMQEPGNHTTQLGAAALPAGIYRCVLRSGDGIESQIVVIES